MTEIPKSQETPSEQIATGWDSLENYTRDIDECDPSRTKNNQSNGYAIDDPIYRKSTLFGDTTGALIDMTPRGILDDPKISLQKRSFKIIR